MARAQVPVLANGVYAALLTPRKPGTADADAAALLDYLDRAIHAGVNGIVLFGATGEFIHFDPAERMRAAALAIRRSRVPAIVNISHSTMVGTIALAEGAMKVGAAGLLLMPPYFYRYGDEDIFAFYQEITAILEGQVAIYVYNLPAFTNPLSVELITRLLQLPGVAGIKDSSGDPKLLSHLQQLRKRFEFRLLAGNESLYVEARMAGADGTVSGLAAALPELLVALDRAILSREEHRVLLLRQRLCEFLGWVEVLPPVLAIRETAAFRGWIKNEAVLPMSPATQAKVRELHAWLAVWLPTVIAECAAVQARRP